MAHTRDAASFEKSAWFVGTQACSSKRIDTRADHHPRLQRFPGDGLGPARGILIGSLAGLVAWTLLLLLLRSLVG